MSIRLVKMEMYDPTVDDSEEDCTGEPKGETCVFWGLRFNVTYSLTLKDGSVYYYTFKGVENPFKESLADDVELYDLIEKRCLKCGNSWLLCDSIDCRMVKPPDKPKKITMAEIEEKFGGPVEIVEDEDEDV